MQSIPKENRFNPDAPAVSIILPAYRAAKFIGHALDSVFSQTFQNFETIVIDDGSPDAEELERALDGFRDRITLLSQNNRGPGAARNTGILRAKGEFIAFLDTDDYWYPNYLAEQMARLEGDPTLELVYADALFVGDSPLAGRTFMDTIPSNGEVTLESLLDARCTIVLSGVVARRQTIIDAGMFDEQFRYAEDYDLWLRIARSGARLTYQRKVLLCKRRHPESLCADDMKLFENALRVLDNIECSNDLTANERAALTRHKAKLVAYLKLQSGKLSLSRGQFTAAVEDLTEANEFYHSWKLRWVLFWLRFSPNLLCRLYNYYRPVTLEFREK